MYISAYIYIHIPLYPIIWLYPSTSRCIRYPMISHFTPHFHIVPIKAPWKPHNALPHAGVNMTGPRLKHFHLLSSGQNPAVPASGVQPSVSSSWFKPVQQIQWYTETNECWSRMMMMMMIIMIIIMKITIMIITIMIIMIVTTTLIIMTIMIIKKTLYVYV